MHRELDGVRERDFQRLLRRSRNRSELQEGYVALYAKASQAPQDYCWFDKTPQNIYGLPLLLADFPTSPVVFLVRHPLNSVASIFSGSQIKGLSLKASICLWNEAWQIVNSTASTRVVLLSYEELTSDCATSIDHLGKILGGPYRSLDKSCIQAMNVSPEANKYTQILSSGQIKRVTAECAEGMSLFGYKDQPGLTRLLTGDQIPSSHRLAQRFAPSAAGKAYRLLQRITNVFRSVDSSTNQ